MLVETVQENGKKCKLAQSNKGLAKEHLNKLLIKIDIVMGSLIGVEHCSHLSPLVLPQHNIATFLDHPARCNLG